MMHLKCSNLYRVSTALIIKNARVTRMIFKYIQNPVFVTFLINCVFVIFEVHIAETMKVAMF
jgi:hypothetical protein